MLCFLYHRVNPVVGFFLLFSFFYENMEVTLMEVLLEMLTLAHCNQMLVDKGRKGSAWRNPNTPTAAVGGWGESGKAGVLTLYLPPAPLFPTMLSREAAVETAFLAGPWGCFPAYSTS